MSRSRELKIIFLLAFLATLVRLVYGWIYEPWMQSNDQISWQIAINDSHLSYDQLIHYPHEGGSFLFGFISSFFSFFGIKNSLLVTAVLFDFGIRLIQLRIVHKLFSFQLAAVLGAWFIFASPILIPWGTLLFGLHASSAIFPFLLLYLLSKNNNSNKTYLLHGIFLGLACWFSYINLVLVPIYMGALFFSDKRSFKMVYAAIGFSVILIGHLLLRTYLDAGFHAEEMAISSIRGTTFAFFEKETWLRIIKVFIGPLSSSGVAVEGAPFFLILRYAWLILAFLGAVFAVRFSRAKPDAKLVKTIVATLVGFFVIYAISPFYASSSKPLNFIAYRHLTYALPLLMLLVFRGWMASKWKFYGLIPIFSISFFSAILVFNSPISTGTKEKEAGWTLGQKFGHDPERLVGLIQGSDYDKSALTEGAAWGFTTVLFNGMAAKDSIQVEEKIGILIDFVNHFSDEDALLLCNGVDFAFREDVTPVLDPEIRKKINVRLVCYPQE